MGKYRTDLFFFLHKYKVPSHGIKQPAQRAQKKVVVVNEVRRF